MHILGLTVRFHVRLIGLVSQIQCYIEEINDSFVDIDLNFQTVSFECSDYFLFYFLSLAGTDPAVAQPVIAEQAEADLEVLEFIEDVEADNITGLGAVKGSHGDVKVLTTFLLVYYLLPSLTTLEAMLVASKI